MLHQEQKGKRNQAREMEKTTPPPPTDQKSQRKFGQEHFLGRISKKQYSRIYIKIKYIMESFLLKTD